MDWTHFEYISVLKCWISNEWNKVTWLTPLECSNEMKIITLVYNGNNEVNSNQIE